jgi:predicted AAA+ superfamily ATPase
MFIPRLLKLPLHHSLFLFGARGTGKSTLLQKLFPDSHTLRLDLLDIETEERLARRPRELVDIVHALPSSIKHVLIDAIQKIPKLLDTVHLLIEEK